MKYKYVDVYLAELAECLKKDSVEELEAFVEAHKGLFEKEFLDKWAEGGRTAKLICLYKLMANNPCVPNNMKCYARQWLKDHRCSTRF